MRSLSTAEDVDAALKSQLALIFKHSTSCPISATAHEEVAAFSVQHADVPVYIVRVIEDRTVSQYLSEKTGIAHQSPQVMVTREGKIDWHTSHFSINQESLEEHT